MFPGDVTLVRRVVLVGVSGLMVLGSPAQADHVKKNTDLEILRTPLGDGQGYLNFVQFSNGAEYTGYTNGNETFRDGGQDISDNSFSTKVIIVTDSNGETTSTASGAQFEDDTEFTRKVWAQAGLSFNFEGVANVNDNDFSGIGEFPFDASDRFELAENGAGRSTNSKTMNLYYAKSFSKPDTLGTTRNAAAGGPRYIFVQDGRDSTTVAHEIGHMLFNGSAVHMPIANDSAHSGDPVNLVFPSSDAGISSLTDIGPQLGVAVGGHAQLEPSQIQAVHGNTGANNPGFVSHSNNAQSAGDMADFNWVADHELIERISGSSNSADLRDGGQDFLIWEIDASQVFPGPDRGHKAGKLDAQAYDGSSFNAVDVFSNINRYADNDFTPGVAGRDGADPEPIRRAKALDYAVPEFSEDGIDWEDGKLTNVFKPGWTNAATSDNYVARWSTDLDAQFVRIARIPIANNDGHDGNAQIDAVMAVQNQPVVLEPTTFNLDDLELDPGPGALEWNQASVNREVPVGKGTVEYAGSINRNDPNSGLLDIRLSAGDSTPGDGKDTKAQLDFEFVPSVTLPTLPQFTDNVTFISLGGPNLRVTGGPFDPVEDVGRIIPIGQGIDDPVSGPIFVDSLFDISFGPDRDFFDMLFAYTVDEMESQIMQIHGEVGFQGLQFTDVIPRIFPPFPDNTDSNFLLNILLEDTLGMSFGESAQLANENVPLFSLSFAGAMTAVPTPTTMSMMGFMILFLARRPDRAAHR